MVILVGATAWVKSPFGVIVFLAILLATEWPARRAGQGTPRFGSTVAWVAGVWLGFYLLWLGTLSFATSARVVTNRLLVQQYAHRIEGRINTYHVQGPGYYAITVAEDFGPLLLLPAGLFALRILASRRGWKFPRYETRYEITLLVVWALAAPVLGTASISKRPWYAYMSYPGIALLLAMSGDRLARAVSGRRSVQAALLAAIPLIHAGRRIPPAACGRPKAGTAASRGGSGRSPTRDSRIRVVPGPASSFLASTTSDPARHGCSSASSSGSHPGTGRRRTPAGRPWCVLQDVPEGVDALELQPATHRDAALFLIDDCGGKVREQVSRR